MTARLTNFLAKKLGRLHRHLPGVRTRRNGTGEQPVREPLSRNEIVRELRLPPGRRWSGVPRPRRDT